jgi:hypothetical protein
MIRDLVDRFAYRHRLWAGEKQGDKVGAGEAPPEASPRNEPAWRLHLTKRWSERPPAWHPHFAWLTPFHFERRALPVAVAQLRLVRC